MTAGVMNPRAPDAAGEWRRLEAQRGPLLKRCERFAELTLPYLWTPDGGDADRDGTSREWQSIGAQCVNNLATRLMLTLFSPSRPFIRLDADDDLRAKAVSENLSESDLTKLLGEAERQAVKKLDQLALRPRLFEVLKHLIVAGNVLMTLDEKKQRIRAQGVKHFVVKRDIACELHTLIIKERVSFDELAQEAQEATPAPHRPQAGAPDAMVDFYIRVVRDGEKYTVTQWVGSHRLPEAFDKSYTPEKLPYRVLTWNLPDEANYGSGLVSDCEGDFEALSTLSRAQIEGAVMASEYRWLLSPGSTMRPEDFEKAANGTTVPGQKGDLELVNAAAALGAAMEVQHRLAVDYINRLGRAFLLSSAVTRDAERVTAEEIRLLAQELETGLGGGYSRLAVDVQLPLGMWLLALVDSRLTKGGALPTVVTGLDALSRNGDLAAMQGFLTDVVKIGTLPPEALVWLKLNAIFTDLGTGHGVDGSKYVQTAEAVAAIQRQQQQAQVAAQVATEAGKAAAQGTPAQ